MSSKLLVIIMIIGVVLVLIGTSALSTQFTNNDGLIHGKGTVKYLSFEGGFYGIVGDDGENSAPINMPQEFKVDGLRVQFTATLQTTCPFTCGVTSSSYFRLKDYHKRATVGWIKLYSHTIT